MAFSVKDYRELLKGLLSKGYNFGPIREYFATHDTPAIFVRHDVDRIVSRAVEMAKVEYEYNIRTTYYFRCRPGGIFPEKAIKAVQNLGHEVGYHYETMVRGGGDPQRSFELFCQELASLRKLALVDTVAAHGSPLSRYSNMGFTSEINLASLGIVGEPSVDIDFSGALYITDTGGQFGSSYNRRDRVEGQNFAGPKTALEVVESLIPREYPRIVLNCHPERWANSPLGYIQAQAADIFVNIAKVIASSTQSSSAQIGGRNSSKHSPVVRTFCDASVKKSSL